MKEIILFFVIGLSLSADAFSLSLSLTDISDTKKKIFPIIVGIFHFVMPIIGSFINSQIISLVIHATNTLGGIILFYLGIKTLLEGLSRKKLNHFDASIFYLAFLVSIDSLSMGIGLSNMSTNLLLGPFIFSIISALITFIGIKLSNSLYKKYNNISTILASIVLMILGIVHLCK